MASVNKVTLIGNLGRAPEIRKTQNGVSVCSFSIATTDKFKDSNGQLQETTEWHNITAWNKQAEVIEKFFQKGDPIYIEGKLKTQSWEDNGIRKFKTEIVVLAFEFLKSKSQSNQNNGFEQQPPQPQGNSFQNNSFQNDDPFQQQPTADPYQFGTQEASDFYGR